MSSFYMWTRFNTLLHLQKELYYLLLVNYRVWYVYIYNGTNQPQERSNSFVADVIGVDPKQ
jgi:hypothetical protein